MMIWSDPLVTLAILGIVGFSEMAGFFWGGQIPPHEALPGLLLTPFFAGLLLKSSGKTGPLHTQPPYRHGLKQTLHHPLLPLLLLVPLAFLPPDPQGWLPLALATPLIAWLAHRLPRPQAPGPHPPAALDAWLLPLGLTALLFGTLRIDSRSAFLASVVPLAVLLLTRRREITDAEAPVPLPPAPDSAHSSAWAAVAHGLLGGLLFPSLWRILSIPLDQPIVTPLGALLALSGAWAWLSLWDRGWNPFTRMLPPGFLPASDPTGSSAWSAGLRWLSVAGILLGLPWLAPNIQAVCALLRDVTAEVGGPVLPWLVGPGALSVLLILPLHAFRRLTAAPARARGPWEPMRGMGFGLGLTVGSSWLLSAVPPTRLPGLLLAGLLLPALARSIANLKPVRQQRPEHWVRLLGLLTGILGLWLIPTDSLLSTARATHGTAQGEAPATPVRAVGVELGGSLTVQGASGAPLIRLAGQTLSSPDDAAQERLAVLLPLLLRPLPASAPTPRAGMGSSVLALPSAAVLYGPGTGVGAETLLEQGITQLTVAAPTPLRLQTLLASQTRLPLLSARLNEGASPLKHAPPTTLLRSAPKTPLLIVLAPPLLERRGLYTREGFRTLAELLLPDGLICVVLPLDHAQPLLPTLAAFKEQFATPLAFLDQGTRSSLILVGSPQPFQPSLAHLTQRMGHKNTAERLRSLGVLEPADVLELLLLPPKSFEKLPDPPLTRSGPRLYSPDPSLPSDAGPVLLPYLEPIAGAFTDLPQRNERLLLDARLEQARLRHASWLELVGHLERGTLLQAMQDVEALRPPGAPADPRLDALIAPYLDRVDALNLQTRHDKAMEQLAVARLLNPGSEKVWRKLGDTFRLKGETQRAKEAYARALELAPTSLEAALSLSDLLRERKALGEATTVLQGLVGKIPPSAVLHHNLGLLALAQDQPQQAQEALIKATQLDPLLAEAHTALARLYLGQGRLDAARQEAETGARLKASPETLTTLGQARMRSSDVAGAKTAFLQALSLDPDQVEAKGTLGILYAEAGQIEEARATWEAVLAIDPQNSAAQKNLEALNRDFPPRASRKGSQP